MSSQRLLNAALTMVIVALVVSSIYGGIAAFQSLSVPTPKHTISVSGIGSVTVAPDEAHVTVGTVTQADSAQQASSANAQIMSQVIALLHSLGIGNDSISTVSYYVSPLYNVKPNGSQTIIGYQVQHMLLVRVQNSDLNELAGIVGKIVDSAIGAGANQVSGIEFTVSDSVLKQTKNQALQAAIRDASSQAQAMASALGVRITGVESVSQGGPIYPPVYAVPMATGEKSTPIAPGTFTVSATVQVAYDVQ